LNSRYLIRDARRGSSRGPDVKHYGVYNEKREEAVNLAIAWRREHLK
jgi:hypothetical protein